MKMEGIQTHKTDLIVEATRILSEAGIENARFEAQLLLAMTLGIARSSVVAQTYAVPDEELRTRFTELVRQRAQRVPLAYLRGSQEFYGREFLVTPAVLVPRPETELVVEKVLMLLKKISLSVNQQDRQGRKYVLMADVGTGSGCIPIALLGEQPKLRAFAFDISAAALEVARQNASTNGVSARLRFIQGNLLTGARVGRFDIIVSNPPYIPSRAIPFLQREVSEYEPRLALDGGADGLDIYRRLIAQSYQVLKSPGWLFLEVGWGQSADVAGLLQEAGFDDIQAAHDFAGIERVVQGRKT